MTQEYGELSLKALYTTSECGWMADSVSLPQTEALKKLKQVDWKNYQLRVYLGCWCSDSKKMIPEFIALKEAVGISDKQIRYFNLDLNKTSPSAVEKQDSILYVPTIVVLKNGIETGRIVETVPEDLASALLVIL